MIAGQSHTCGGDADTTAAIVGGIVGASVGESGIPAEWLAKLCEWPRTVVWMRRLGMQLAEAASSDTGAIPTSFNFGFVLMRNMVFLAIVLFHGFRRLLPPY